MKKSNNKLNHVRVEVALEILSVKIASEISASNKNLKKLCNEREKIFQNDEKTINKVLDEYGIDVKKLIKGGKNVISGKSSSRV